MKIPLYILFPVRLAQLVYFHEYISNGRYGYILIDDNIVIVMYLIMELVLLE